MRFILLFLMFFSFPLKIYSIDVVYKKEINWSFNQRDTLLSFNNASYPDSVSKLPYYNESFEMPFVYNLIISDIKYIDIPFKIEGKNKYFTDSVVVKQQKGFTRNKYFNSFSFLPIIYSKDKSKAMLVKSFTVRMVKIVQTKKSIAQREYIGHSVLSSGKWVKIKLKEDGIYKLSYEQLSAWFSNPENVRVYGNGGGLLSLNTNTKRVDDLKEVATYSDYGNDGTFSKGDYILFYGQSPDIWCFDPNTQRYKHSNHIYSEYSYYFLTDGYGKGNTVQVSSEISDNPSIIINTFDDFAYTESDEINFIRSGSEWYGNRLNYNVPKVFSYSFPDLLSNEEAFVFFDVVAKAITKSSFVFGIGNSKKTYNINCYATSSNYHIAGFDLKDSLKANVSGSGVDLSVEFKNSSDADAAGYINYIGINVVRNLKFNGSQLQFRNKKTYNSGSIIKYQVENANNCQVWDITDINNVKAMTTHAEGTQLWFKANSDTLRNFIIFNGSSYLAPIIDGDMGVIENQDIHGSEVPDLIIVSPNDSDIYKQAKRLADFRIANDGLKVLLVSTQQVYNEFSSGKRDLTAIRDMVKMFYDRSVGKDDMVDYLLLFGKGTYANHVDKDYNYNLIPTYESEESLEESFSYTTDDFYGWMNSTGTDYNNLLDIGVGRLPVKNADEAKAVVDKLINYENPKYDADWHNIICFIGDDQDQTDGNDFVQRSEDLASFINENYPSFVIQKIYLDAYVQNKTSIGDRYPDANFAVNNRINNGALIVNYTGHGSERQLAHEDIIDKASIRQWSNKNKLPLFITATCQFSRFDNVNLLEQKSMTSAGEEVLLTPDGGGIGLMTTTRPVNSSGNYSLNIAFYKFAFKKGSNGEYYRLGDVFRLAKNDAILTGDNRLNFTLLGDPSMMLGFPKNHGISTDSINNTLIDDTDTIRALSVVKINGHFSDNSNFSGNLYATVYDKLDSMQTLANDGSAPAFTFTARQNIIFKGIASIDNGSFEFSFPVPKDIKYNFGSGKIVYYATDGNINYADNFSDFIVGGLNNDAEIDYNGPEIELFMNNKNFKDGGITNSSPSLYAKIFDKDGINATGSGIGHDITAIIDNNISNIYILNDYYSTEINEYQKGTVLFPFTGLEKGKHTLKLTAWDIFNNPSDVTLDFEVVGDDNMIMKQIFNFPNPMRNETSFVIEHNWPNKEITLEISIYSFSGSLVNILKYKGTSEGFRTSPIRWNGLDGSGHVAGKGVYIYKAKMTGEDGTAAENYGKLVIVR